MPSYLVETYLARGHAGERAARERRARSAAVELTRGHARVRFERAICRAMPDNKALRCDCGHRVTASDEAGLLAEIRLHSREAHETAFTVEDALLVALRSQFDVFRAPAKRSGPTGALTKGGPS